MQNILTSNSESLRKGGGATYIEGRRPQAAKADKKVQWRMYENLSEYWNCD